MVSKLLDDGVKSLGSHEAEYVAGISAAYEIASQMTGMGQFSEELNTGIDRLDAVFRAHLAEYNLRLKPILTQFHLMSLKFSEAVRSDAEALRTEFFSNLQETFNALTPIMGTMMKMARHFQESIAPYIQEFRSGTLAQEDTDRFTSELTLILQKLFPDVNLSGTTQ